MNAESMRYEVYLLDMLWDEEAQDWTENMRHKLGELEIVPVLGCEIDDEDILQAMKRFEYSDIIGRRYRGLDTSDRRVVYAEDYYGSGEWWEVGNVKDHVPVYGLKLKEDAA